MKFYCVTGTRFDRDEFCTSKREAIARAKEVGGLVTVECITTPALSRGLVLACLNGAGYATKRVEVYEGKNDQRNWEMQDAD